MKKNFPYLSVVATSRNDNHGGNTLWRTQHFIDGLAYQAEKFELLTELVLVDWNPPKNKKSLFEALKWPKNRKFFQFRVIQVPQKYHNQFESSKDLPLFQYIAKNVGIKRSKGEFVLSTNIDILFSNKLFSYLKKGLEKGFIYRATRYDIEPDIPADLDFDGILNHVKNKIIRVNSRYITMSYKIFRLENLIRYFLIIPLLVLWRHPYNMVRFFYKLKREQAVFGERIRCIPLDFLVYKQTRLHHKLHTNACGDFTLMSKDNWEKLRGYPEFEMYSWHIDSILLYQAHFMNIPTKALSDKCAIYHIEHGMGSGWTPEGAQLLFNRLREKEIKFLTDKDLQKIYLDCQAAKKTGKSILYNDKSWGGSGVDFQERGF